MVTNAPFKNPITRPHVSNLELKASIDKRLYKKTHSNITDNKHQRSLDIFPGK